MGASTSFRLSEDARAALAGHAARTGASVTSALEQLILEATRAADFPGIVYRGPVGARRAAIAGGPDVWEVVARIQEVSGTLNTRVDQVHAESGIATSLVQLAMEFAAAHPDEIAQFIDRHEAAITRSQELVSARDALLA
jgi:hypothetical protein